MKTSIVAVLLTACVYAQDPGATQSTELKAHYAALKEQMAKLEQRMFDAKDAQRASLMAHYTELADQMKQLEHHLQAKKKTTDADRANLTVQYALVLDGMNQLKLDLKGKEKAKGRLDEVAVRVFDLFQDPNKKLHEAQRALDRARMEHERKFAAVRKDLEAVHRARLEGLHAELQAARDHAAAYRRDRDRAAADRAIARSDFRTATDLLRAARDGRILIHGEEDYDDLLAQAKHRAERDHTRTAMEDSRQWLRAQRRAQARHDTADRDAAREHARHTERSHQGEHTATAEVHEHHHEHVHRTAGDGDLRDAVHRLQRELHDVRNMLEELRRHLEGKRKQVH